MAKMKKHRKYRSKITAKSSWNKRVSCRQNMRKGRIKGNYKRRSRKNVTYIDVLIGVIFEIILRLGLSAIVIWWMISLNS